MSGIMRKTGIVLLLAIMLLQVGCSKKVEKQNNNITTEDIPESYIDIYYCDESDVEILNKGYQIKQLGNLSASIEEVLVFLTTNKIADKKRNYFQDGITYNGYVIDESNNLTVTFKLDKENYDMIDFYLTKAALCSTLFQIQEINTVSIVLDRVDNVNLENDIYNRKSFYYYSSNQVFNEDESVSLYIPNDDGTKLKRIESNVTLDYRTSIQSIIIDKLKEYACIPNDTEVNSVFVSDGICYLDLNSNFLDDTNQKSEMVIFSIINSLTVIPDINTVQFYIDGEVLEYYRETVKINLPLEFNEEIVE